MNQFLKLSNYLLLVLILTGNSCAAASQPSPLPDVSIGTLIPYAPIKRPASPTEHRNAVNFRPPAPVPTVGILIAVGSFNGLATWTLVDLDARKLSEIRTQLIYQSDDKYNLHVIDKIERSLSVMETNEIISQANTVWNPGSNRPSPPPFVTDVTCDVVLFDHDDALDDRGQLCPDNQLVNVIAAIETPGLKVP